MPGKTNPKGMLGVALRAGVPGTMARSKNGVPYIQVQRSPFISVVYFGKTHKFRVFEPATEMDWVQKKTDFENVDDLVAYTRELVDEQ